MALPFAMPPFRCPRHDEPMADVSSSRLDGSTLVVDVRLVCVSCLAERLLSPWSDESRPGGYREAG